MNQWNKYEPTAARKHGKPGPRGQAEEHHHRRSFARRRARAAEFVKPHLAATAMPLVTFANAETKALNQKQEGDIIARATAGEAAGRSRCHGPRHADDQAAAAPVLLRRAARRSPCKSAQMVNDGVAEFVARKPDRLKGFGTVPMPDGNEAAKELERCVTKLGFKGVQVLTNVNGKELSDPAFAPFWKKAEELGVLVVIHPNGFTQAERLSRFYFNNVIGNPLETTIALHYLIFDGVLERHPNLKILAVHGGGYLASYSGRIDHAWGARSDSHGNLPHPPTSYLKRLYFDTVVFTPHQLQELVRLYGCRSHSHGHRLSLRHGGLRPDRPCLWLRI